jgi:hypothetical protein
MLTATVHTQPSTKDEVKQNKINKRGLDGGYLAPGGKGGAPKEKRAKP